MAYVNSLYFTLNAINIFNHYKKNLVHNDPIHDYKVSQNVSEDIIKSAKIDFEIQGKENVESSDPILVTSNHVGFFDIAALCYSIDKPLPFAAAKELIDNRIINQYIEAIGSVLIDRKTEDLKIMKKQLEDMEKAISTRGLILFPEGECSYGEGDIKEFKKGGFIAAKKHDTLIVPTYIDYKDFKRIGRLIVPKKGVKVIFGESFKPSEITDKKMSAQELANYTRKKVLDLRNNQ
ncbi:MAG: 1-acyl-sn-glycerol-3-phosphate acyltransferase [Bacilli bacterium]|nr:1-acyl-sn-glycerol-3-phosphate acyltransferase [Bacilli bacterium]